MFLSFAWEKAQRTKSLWEAQETCQLFRSFAYNFCSWPLARFCESGTLLVNSREYSYWESNFLSSTKEILLLYETWILITLFTLPVLLLLSSCSSLLIEYCQQHITALFFSPILWMSQITAVVFTKFLCKACAEIEETVEHRLFSLWGGSGLWKNKNTTYNTTWHNI